MTGTFVERAILDEACARQLEPVNTSTQGIRTEVANLIGRFDRLDKDVSLLLQKQLKAAVTLPGPSFVAQADNIDWIYRLAHQRHVSVPTGLKTDLRLKMSSMDADTPSYWRLASNVLQDASTNRSNELLLSMDLPVMRLGGRNTGIMNSRFERVRIILGNQSFLVNSHCDDCIIEYAGDSKPNLDRSTFTNCIFIVHVDPDEPPPPPPVSLCGHGLPRAI